MINNLFKGCKSLMLSFRMFAYLLWWIFIVLFIFQIIVFASSLKMFPTKFFNGEKGYNLYYLYYQSHLYHYLGKKIFFINNEPKKFTDVVKIYKPYINRCNHNLLILAIFSSSVYLLLPFFIYLFHNRYRKEILDRKLRGGDIISPSELNNLIKSKPETFYGDLFQIGDNISLPLSVINTHAFIIGRPGVGKSLMIYKIIEKIIDSGYKAIIHDFKGDMISYFYNSKKHLIFNPLDKRHLDWNIFKDLRNRIVVDTLAASHIPDTLSKEQFFPNSARQLLVAILIYCIKSGNSSYDDLWKLCNYDFSTLSTLFKETPGCEEGLRLLSDNETTQNVMSCLSNYTKIFRYLVGTDGNFSVLKWVQDPNPQKKIIFVSNYAMIQESQKLFISLFFDFATKALCSMPDDLSRRLFFVLDEVGQMSQLPSIVQLLTQSRSKGGSVILSIQDLAQLNTIYGKDGATTIFNSCRNTILFSVKDPDTAEFISRNISTQEIERSGSNFSMNVSNNKDNISTSRSITEKRIVMPSEIINLPSRNFFLQMCDCPTTRDTIAITKRKVLNKPFNIRKDFDLVVKKRNVQDNSIELIEDDMPFTVIAGSDEKGIHGNITEPDHDLLHHREDISDELIEECFSKEDKFVMKTGLPIAKSNAANG